MAVTWKRRALALSAPLALAVAVAAAVSGRGCQQSEAGPEEAVRDFLEAAASIDRQRMFERLGPRTRTQLETSAREATDRSSRRYGASEMIGVDSQIDVFELEGARDFVEVKSESEDAATVEIRDRRGQRHRVNLVREDGRWLIELVAAD